MSVLASDQIIDAGRDQYVRGVIELEDFEGLVERALIDQEIDEVRGDGRPSEDEWVRQAVKAHRLRSTYNGLKRGSARTKVRALRTA